MNSEKELITEVRLLQANLDVLCDNLEKLSNLFPVHQEKDSALRTELALIRQKQEQYELKLDDLIRIVSRGTTRDESLVSQIKSLQQAQEESSKHQQNKIAFISLIIALVSALAAIAAAIAPLFANKQ